MKRILWVADVQNWALANTGKAIQKHIDMDIVYVSDEPRFDNRMLDEYDHIHSANWLDLQTLSSHPKVTGGVCSHNWFLKWLGVAKKELPKFKKLVAISQKLFDKVKHYNPNTFYIPNGVDMKLFQSVKHTGEFVVGWCGQKTTGGFGELKTKEKRPIYDIKGYELLLKPLMKVMGNTRFKVLARDYTTAMDYEEMPEWYSDIDVLICTSLWEGCPFPVLEAASCGKAVISTHVGIVPELIKDGHNGFIVDNVRSRENIPKAINTFKNHINLLKSDRDLCYHMGNNNREAVMKFSWGKVMPKWKEIFWD